MEELFLYYPNLLIVEYNGKKKAKATIELFTYLIFVNLIFLQIQNAFDWKTAVGNQLDIIGKWVGVSRSYQGSNFWGSTFFSYPETSRLVPTDETDTLQHGYSDYETFDSDTGNILTYDDLGFVEQSLSDDDYRTIIGLKIIKNSINHTTKNIDDAIWNYFGGQTFYSNQSIGIGTTLYNNEELTEIYGDIYSITDGATIIQNVTKTYTGDWNTPQVIGTNSWLGAVYGNNIFVAVGTNGYMTTSTDGINWTTPFIVGQNLNINWFDITFSNNIFVAVGTNGYIATSTDGTNWTYQKISTKFWRSITFGNGKFVILGYDGYTAISTDGIIWEVSTSAVSSYDTSWTAVAYGNNIYVAVNDAGYISTSYDGKNWSSARIGNSWKDITFGNGKFIVVAGNQNIAISSDGKNWTISKPYLHSWRSINYGNGLFIVGSNIDDIEQGGYVITSVDGVNWSEPIRISTLNYINSIISGNNKFIVFSQNGYISYTDINISYTSETNYKYINNLYKNNKYTFFLGNVYTTWQPHQITYHYPTDLTTIIEVCNYKNVLPAPTGVKIVLSQI